MNFDFDDDDDGAEPIVFPVGAADNCKVGFFKQDRFSQTEVSEIIEIEELTGVLQKLKEDCDALKRDLALSKGMLVSDFERKLRGQALDLYQRMNDKVSGLERAQGERVNVVRRAFKMQLTDALIQVHSMYDKNFESRMNANRNRNDRSAVRKDARIRELEETVKRNESVIHMLKLRLAELQEARADEEDESPTLVMSPEPTPTPPAPPTPSPPAPPETPKVSRREFEALEEELQEMKDKLRHTEDLLESSKSNSGSMAAERAELMTQLEEARALTEQLSREKEALERQLEEAAEEARAAAGEREEKWRRDLEAQLEKARQEGADKMRGELAGMQDSERQKHQKLQEQLRKLEQRLLEEREENRKRMDQLKDAEALRRREQALAAQVARLKAELERNQRAWEKKFAILRQSLHALKDESYIRQTMQRQAAQLHQAAVMYASDVPVGMLPRPLLAGQHGDDDDDAEEVEAGRAMRPRGNQDAFSYTVSVPQTAATPGGGGGAFDEDQILSDGEEQLPAGTQPLPSPPVRRRTPLVRA